MQSVDHPWPRWWRVCSDQESTQGVMHMVVSGPPQLRHPCTRHPVCNRSMTPLCLQEYRCLRSVTILAKHGPSICKREGHASGPRVAVEFGDGSQESRTQRRGCSLLRHTGCCIPTASWWREIRACRHGGAAAGVDVDGVQDNSSDTHLCFASCVRVFADTRARLSQAGGRQRDA